MTQHIDIRYRDRAESSPLNSRFRDITGACVLYGYRFSKGTLPFTVTFLRDGFDFSAAVSPSGAKIMEDVDQINAITIDPNNDPVGSRMDSVYLSYQYGTQEAIATYTVIQGTPGSDVPAPNPNRLVNTLLGYIKVPPNGVDLYAANFLPVPYGFSKLEVAGPAWFHDLATFDKPVTFNGPVVFNDVTTGGSGGTGSGGGSQPAQIVRLPFPIVAAPGQTEFTLPSDYMPNTSTLFVFVDWVLQPPALYLEKDSTHFDFYEGLNGGESVWAWWVKNINIYQAVPHNHDDRYYTKQQIQDRSTKYITDFFAGPTGRTITHNLATLNYVILGVTTTTRTTDVGDISVDKRANEIVVYNTGSYRGEFDIAYLLKF